MTSIRASGLTLLICSLGALTACETGQEPFNFLKKNNAVADETASTEAPEELITVIGGNQDVEAPEIFNVTDKALWDGRPSLGGVWVAHSSVKDPQRVVIRNPANGKSVNGALFRREIDNPGPSLQLSSDAADQLGLLAGQPSTLEVVAIKRIEARAPAPVTAPPPTSAPASAPETATDPEAKTTVKADALPAEVAEAKPTKAEERKAKREARKKERAAAKAALAAAAAETAALATATPTTRPKKKPVSESTIEQKPLDEVVSTAEAAIANAAGQAATADPAAAAAAPAIPAASEKLKRPFVQIAVFSVEANAEGAAADMRRAGLTATVKTGSQDGKSFWRVIVGPAVSVADRDAMSVKIKTLGYPDAYPVTK